MYMEEEDFVDFKDQDQRPRSRLLLRELAIESREKELDAFSRVKHRVSINALRGIGVLVCAVVMSAFFLQFLRSNSEQVDVIAEDLPSVSQTAAAQSSPTPTTVTVHVAGAVHNPGVYSLQFGDRINDALKQAGGAKEDAHLDSINLAQPVLDGQQIYIPVVGEEIPGATATQGMISSDNDRTAAPSSGLININTASATELEELPRVGPATAQKIVEFREANGKFTQLEDLLAIPGIGEKTLQNFEGQVTF